MGKEKRAPDRSTDLVGELAVAVFTYERPKHLENFLESLERATPRTSAFIVDDGSRGRRWKGLSAALENSDHILMRRTPEPIRRRRLTRGRLYRNIEWLLSSSAVSTRYVLLAQDDLQFVRALNGDDFVAIQEAHERSDSPFLGVTFGKHTDHNKSCDCLGYLHKAHHQRFSAVCIVDQHRLSQRNWRWGKTEKECQSIATFLDFPPMPFLKAPFIHYLPSSPPRPAPESVLERIFAASNQGMFPIEFLSPTESALLKCGGSELPIADDWLSLAKRRSWRTSPRKPWQYVASEPDNAFQRTLLALLRNR